MSKKDAFSDVAHAVPFKRAANVQEKHAPSKKGRGLQEQAPSSLQYTPLERQILQLKAQHPDKLLLIEVGYKMKFYEKDATIASQILNIVCVSY